MFSNRYYNECAPGNVHTQCPQPDLTVVTFPVYAPWFLKQCVLALTTADTGDETVRDDFCLLLAWDPLGRVF